MGQIFLVRHGQASFDSADYDRLSELGFEQARVLGTWFAQTGQRFTRVTSGSLLRQRQTAEACMNAHELALRPAGEWQVDPCFNEYAHVEVLRCYRPELGDSAQLRALLEKSANPRAAFQEMFAAAMSRWMSGRFDEDYSESWPAFRQRCWTALERLVQDAERGDSVAVFTSGGVIAALCQRLLDMSDAATARLSWGLVNCGVTRVLFQPGQVSLSYLNNHAHLERMAQPHVITFR